MIECVASYGIWETAIIALLGAIVALIIFCIGVVLGSDAERRRWKRHNADWAKASYPGIWKSRTEEGRLGDLLQKLRDKYSGDRDA